MLVEIRDLAKSDLPEAALLLSRGMADNPICISVFGGDDAHRQRVLARFFTTAISGTFERGSIGGAFKDGKLLGVCGMTPPGKCQPTGPEKLKIIPAILLSNPPSVLPKVLGWVGEWAKHDPKQPHWHIGPLAVDRHLRGKGIGSELLRSALAKVDSANGLAYLETDRPTNVTFYERFGFKTVSESAPVGTDCWYMERPATTSG